MTDRKRQSNGITSTLLNKCIRQVLDVSNGIREVPYVTALVQILPLVLNHAMTTEYYDGARRYHLKFTGTLIHGEPVVQFKTNKGHVGCELGDMMVVCKDYETNRQTAAFLQAKVAKTKKSEYVLSGSSSLNQLYLYTKWPKFSLKQNGTKTHDLYPKYADERAMHMIFRHWRRPYVMIAKSQKVMPITYPSLGVYLMQMLKMRQGREFFEQSAGDVWSDLIHDVNMYISNHGFQRCSSLDPGTQFPRVATEEFMSFITSSISDNVLSSNLVDGIRRVIMELPEWVNDSKCFGILTIEKHFEGFCKKCKVESKEVQ